MTTILTSLIMLTGLSLIFSVSAFGHGVVENSKKRTSILPLLGERAGVRAEVSNKSAKNGEYVVLLHGLGRSSLSMKGIEWYLKRRGYHVINARYPTARLSVEQISSTYFADILQNQIPPSAPKIHFVTHSQGGIVLRQYLSNHDLPNLGRVVMLAPPNHGSEICDRLNANPVTRALLGPGFLELGTGADSLPNRLGPIHFDCGVIAGDRSFNPLLSSVLPGPNDGKVTVASAKLDGLKDFLVLHSSHTWLMWRGQTLRQIVSFLVSGRFERTRSTYASAN